MHLHLVLARGASGGHRQDGCLAPGHPVSQIVFGTPEAPTVILVTNRRNGQRLDWFPSGLPLSLAVCLGRNGSATTCRSRCEQRAPNSMSRHLGARASQDSSSPCVAGFPRANAHGYYLTAAAPLRKTCRSYVQRPRDGSGCLDCPST